MLYYLQTCQVVGGKVWETLVRLTRESEELHISVLRFQYVGKMGYVKEEEEG